MKKKLQDFDGFIFDIDGVILRGDSVIDGAKACIDLLRKNNKRYIFVTNHTRFTKEELIKKLRSFDILVEDNQLITASNVTVSYLQEQNPNLKIKVNLIGAEGIIVDFLDVGFVLTSEKPDYVVVAWDTKFNYESIYTACKNIREGARFIVTSPDRYIPSERGFELGFGTIGAAISYATRLKPIYIGKPYPSMIETACKIMGITKKKTLIVGDTAETDLYARTLAGLGGALLVLSGSISKKEIINIPKDQKPTFVLDSIKDFTEYF